MKFEVFQRIYAASDVRTTLVFADGTFTDVFPHIAVQSTMFDISVELFGDPEEGDAGGSSSQVGFVGFDQSQGGLSKFCTLFERCLTRGNWLVVSSMDAVPFQDWRYVSQRLAAVLPDSAQSHMKNFRLLGFLESGTVLTKIAPPLLCQFALQVDRDGNMTSRTDVSPIFKGHSHVEGGATAAGGPGGMQGSPRNKKGNSATLAQGRAAPYLQASDARNRALNLNSGNNGPIGAYDTEYIDEVLCGLRDAMNNEQQALLRLQAEQAWDSDEEEDDGSGAVGGGGAAVGSSVMPSKSIQANTKTGDEDKEWIYHKILAWVVEQCPDADISALPDIPEGAIDVINIQWQTSREVCEACLWCGADVLVKRPQKSLVKAYNIVGSRAFYAEAARHFSLKHPLIIQLYGLTGGNMVMESGRGTLEQALIRSRYDAQRWTVRRYLKLAQCVLRAMCYLESNAIHRDIACRSVIEISEDLFKIGQFQCAIPVRHTQLEACHGKIPVRWSAPEALACEFSPKADVWSFGVMMWEASQYATRVPYDESEEFAAPAIIGGHLLEKPPEIPQQLYDTVILPCLVKDAEMRPSASDVLLPVERALSTGFKESMLNAYVPFPTDNETFENYNHDRGGKL